MPAEPDHRSPGNPLVMLPEILGAPLAAQVTEDPHRLGDMLHGSVAVVVGPAENLLITFDDQGHPRLPVLVAGDSQGPAHMSWTQEMWARLTGKSSSPYSLTPLPCGDRN